MLAVVASVAAAVPAVGAASDPVVISPQLELQVARRVNAVRGWHGLRPLRLSPALKASARSHSRDMGLRGYFEHESANGAPFWSRIARHYSSSGYGRWEVGENLLWRSGRTTAVQVVREWMGSPSHRENLLSRVWQELGVGALLVRHARGAYGGRSVTLVTLDLGVRSR
jgi:uncharacterized protein YkwD